MKQYLYDIVNRISQFSERLDSESVFIDKPWVIIDSDLQQHKYIFKRGGELIMSLNGKVQIGTWEFLAGAKSLLIDRIQDKILLNQSFIDEAIMILKIDGQNKDFFIMANEQRIPDLNVLKYLRAVEQDKLDVIWKRLEDGRNLEIYRKGHYYVTEGMPVTIDGKKATNGVYKDKGNKNVYEIENGEIKRIYYLVKYKTIGGLMITIQQILLQRISLGDRVFIKDRRIEHGKFRIGRFKKITVKDGVITGKSIF